MSPADFEDYFQTKQIFVNSGVTYKQMKFNYRATERVAYTALFIAFNRNFLFFPFPDIKKLSMKISTI